MGKLAERYGDAARSGIYRVGDAAIPRAAAREAEAIVVELTAAGLADGGWPQVEAAIASQGERTCVVLVPDGAALGRPGGSAVLEVLAAAARSGREAGRPFFAVLVDPEALLPLPPLYHERAPQ